MSGYPRALADIGGTNARFALERAPGVLDRERAWPTAGFPGFVAAAAAYLDTLAGERPQVMAVAIAAPVAGDVVRLTNANWEFSIAAAREALGLQRLEVRNDFVALALALPALDASRHRQVGGGDPVAGGALALLGPGSGLGMTALLPAGGRWTTIGTEGGHAGFAPSDERELSVLRYAWRRYTHVSLERVLSGPGIELIHEALREHAGMEPVAMKAAQVTTAALDGSDASCVEAIDCFCSILGSAAGNLAITLDARGGVYIGGGIVPRLGRRLDASPFRERFESKGRFSDAVRAMPTYVITAADATLRGAARALDDEA